MNGKWTVWLATGFGAGYSRVAPGTVGTLWGIPLAWMVFQIPETGLRIVVCTLLCLLAVPVCAAAERRLNRGKDPGCIVADEFMTLPLVYLGLPFSLPVILSGFFLHRLFDITKPPPIRQTQKLKGGIGIVIDDVLAALFALAVNHLLHRGIGAWI